MAISFPTKFPTRRYTTAGVKQGLCKVRSAAQQQGKGVLPTRCVLSACLWHIGHTMSQQELEDQIVDGCHHTRSVAFSQMTPVLVQGLIASVMRAILDAPMSPFDIQHPFGIRFA